MTLFRYLELIRALVAQRSRSDWRPEQDREILAEMADLYETLDDAQREHVEARSTWPAPGARP